jgi:hypothetical protein
MESLGPLTSRTQTLPGIFKRIDLGESEESVREAVRDNGGRLALVHAPKNLAENFDFFGRIVIKSEDDNWFYLEKNGRRKPFLYSGLTDLLVSYD